MNKTSVILSIMAVVVLNGCATSNYNQTTGWWDKPFDVEYDEYADQIVVRGSEAKPSESIYSIYRGSINGYKLVWIKGEEQADIFLVVDFRKSGRAFELSRVLDKSGKEFRFHYKDVQVEYYSDYEYYTRYAIVIPRDYLENYWYDSMRLKLYGDGESTILNVSYHYIGAFLNQVKEVQSKEDNTNDGDI